MDSKLKNNVKDAWLGAFPSLTAYNQSKLYKIIGPFICGIELINLPHSEKYRPHFVMYPLYRKDIKSCLNYPAVMFEFYNNKNLQFDLAYTGMGDDLTEALSIVSTSVQISFQNDVSLNSFYSLLDYVQKIDTTYKTVAGRNASLLEVMFYGTLYVGSEIETQNILDRIEQSSKNWNMKIFESWFGNFGLWFQELQNIASSRDFFLDQIRSNKLDKKISKLNSSELIL